jgi:hypothetical protein
MWHAACGTRHPANGAATTRTLREHYDLRANLGVRRAAAPDLVYGTVEDAARTAIHDDALHAEHDAADERDPRVLHGADGRALRRRRHTAREPWVPPHTQGSSSNEHRRQRRGGITHATHVRGLRTP